MKYCTNCGKEIRNEAKFCCNCGYPTASTPEKNVESPDYSRLRTFCDEARIIYILSILSLALCCGIGFVFQIISFNKIKPYRTNKNKEFYFPEFRLTNRNDIENYETAKSKIRKGYQMTMIGGVICGCLLGIILGCLMLTSF